MTSPVRTAAVVALLGTAATVVSAPFGVSGVPLVEELHGQRVGAGREGCDLVRSRRLNSILTQGGERITYISGPLVFQCEDGTRIQADSVVDFESTRFRRLLGGVEIDRPDTRLVADRVHQSDDAGRIEAWGSVEVEERGSETRMVGDSLIFLESGPNRPVNELTVMGERPFAVLRLAGEGDSGTGGAGTPEPGAVQPETPRAAEAAPPDTVFADLLEMEGESRFVATGSVQVRRADMDAYGDSLNFDRSENVANLFGTPDDLARIDGEAFDLVARRVDLFMAGGALHEILAVDRARLTGQDVEMDAPRIRIFMTDGEMDRLVALRMRTGEQEAEPGTEPTATATLPDSIAPSGAGRVSSAVEEAEHSEPSVLEGGGDAGRPRATAEDFVLRADSIEVNAPGQALDRVFAVGNARGESLGRDSLNTPDMPEIIRNDWIEGDTVVAHFVPTDTLGLESDTGPRADVEPRTDLDPRADAGPDIEPDADSEADHDEGGEGRPEYSLDRLVAIGSARSLYRLAPQDTVSVVSVDEEGENEETEVTGVGPEAAPEDDVQPEDVVQEDGVSPENSPTAADSTAVSDSVFAADSAGATRSIRPRRPPAIHYVVGDRITIVLADGEVERMEVEGQTRGIYLEPVVGPGAGSSGSTGPSPGGGAGSSGPTGSDGSTGAPGDTSNPDPGGFR